MRSIVDENGEPFNPSLTDGLISPEMLFQAVKAQMDRADEVSAHWKLLELRASCGASTPTGYTISIRKPQRFGGK